MKNFLKNIKEKAKQSPQIIVFPEGFDERILEAAGKIAKEKTAIPVLLGNPRTIQNIAEKKGIHLDWKKINIINPKTSKNRKKYAETLYTLRKDKGLTEKGADDLVTRLPYFGTMMVHSNDADGMIAGSTWSTAESIRPALQIIKTKEPFHKVSAFFFMILEKRLLLFADVSITINPDAHDLVDIAADTAHTAKKFGIEPRVAMLSFSTNGSAKHPMADKMREATAMMRYHYPDIPVEGEMQVDSALVPWVCKRKFPNAKVCGDANILIFPDVGAANIAYKLVERLARAKAIGPILQGLKKPVNDLSRGCSVSDIVDLAAITTIEAQELDYKPYLTADQPSNL